MTPQRPRWRRGGMALVLMLALAAATFPAWRVLLLGDRPTVDELLQLRCISALPRRR